MKKINLIPTRFIKLISLVVREQRYFKNIAARGWSYFAINVVNTSYRVVPINQNMALFESYRGINFSCNPKAILEELQSRRCGITCVISVNEPQKEKKIPGCLYVKRLSLKYYYYLVRSRFFINNINFPGHLKKRPGSLHIQTMHGTPLKLMGADIIKISDRAHEINLLNQFIRAKRWDVLISPNQYTSDIFSRAYRYRGNILESGYPRNDILVNSKSDKEKIKNIKEGLKLPSGKKIVLYAPTWRDYEPNSKVTALSDIGIDMVALKKVIGSEYIVLFRLHHLLSSQLEFNDMDSFIFNVSDYPDSQALCLISDVLITDYSSIMFDYALLNKPIISYIYDYEKYIQARGTYFDLIKEGPGAIALDMAMLLEELKNIDNFSSQYAEKLFAFQEKFCGWENGTASSQVVERYFMEEIKS